MTRIGFAGRFAPPARTRSPGAVSGAQPVQPRVTAAIGGHAAPRTRRPLQGY